MARLTPRKIIVWIIVIASLLAFLNSIFDTKTRGISGRSNVGYTYRPDAMTILSVICKGSTGEYMDIQKKQLTTLMKSLVYMSTKPIDFHLIVDTDDLKGFTQSMIDAWPEKYRNKIHLYTYDVFFPDASETQNINVKEIFRPCSTERLFLPDVLPMDITKALYLDTDIIFLRPVDELWKIIESFDDSIIGGFAARLVNVSDERLPYYGKREVNAGVFMMNLQAIRNYPGGWKNEVMSQFHSKFYKDVLGRVVDDQDILNIFTSAYSTRFYNISCEWNYRFFMCDQGDNDRCPDAKKNGISLFHGLGHAFFNCTKNPKFCKVFDTFNDYQLGTSIKTNLYDKLVDGMEDINKNYKRGYRCKKATYFDEMLLKQFKTYMDKY